MYYIGMYVCIYKLNKKQINNPVKKWPKGLHFTKEDMQMANEPIKRDSTSFVTRRVKIITR